jgi:hypothetical protein
MDTDAGPGPTVTLNRADAWLLAAVTEGSHDGRPVPLGDFIHDCDWLGRAIPTFDEVSFGIPRLAHAGYVIVDRDEGDARAFRATEAAILLRRAIGAGSLGEILDGVAAAVGATPYPSAEPPEDRTLGRLSGLTEADLGRFVAAYSAWFNRWSNSPLHVGRAMARITRRRG